MRTRADVPVRVTRRVVPVTVESAVVRPVVRVAAEKQAEVRTSPFAVYALQQIRNGEKSPLQPPYAGFKR